MTEEERQEEIRRAKEDFVLRDGPGSWIWNEEKCQYEPPVPYPDDFDTVIYRWNEYDEINHKGKWEQVIT